MRVLYPAREPTTVEHLELGGGHRVYVEVSGAEEGIPVVFLHGGPGSGCKADHRQFFDPKHYRVVLFDQRGSGRSTPYGGVENNTTQWLIDDMEAIRQHFDIDKWMLFGGSWGASLALAYAEAHPAQVSAMILRGSFLARRQDVDWFFGHGANRLLPQAWARFVETVGCHDVTDLAGYLHDAVFNGDSSTVERVARAWEAWSGAVVMFSIDQSGDGGGSGGSPDSAIAKARLELHYARNGYFIDENQLLSKAHQLPNVPTQIIHGARDITCPAESAWLLHQALPHSKLDVLRTAGHLSSERPMVDALVRASDAMVAELAVD